LLALGGLLAGLAAFAVGEATHKLILAEKRTFNIMGTPVTTATAATQAAADTRNGALAFGALGMCLGGGLGIAGGLARRSAAATVAAGLLGSIVGAALCGGVSLALLPRFLSARVAYSDHEMIISMVMHGLPWGLAGAAAGLAFAVGLGQWRLFARAPAAGLAGAVLGAIAFDLIGAGLFPFADTGAPIATTWPSRLLARLMVTVVTALVIILLLPGPRPVRSADEGEIARPGE
jgi:hypothetical protein